jgi:MFS family permease
MVGRDRLALPLWRVFTGLGITQIIGWGSTYYALGALSQDIAASTGWSKTLIFGAFTAALLISGLVSRWAGRTMDIHGGRKMMAAGSLLSAVGCLLLGFASTPSVYVMGWLVLGLAMRLSLYDAAFPALAQVALGKARRAISYLTLFGGLASTVFWPLSHLISLNFGWHSAFLVYAGLHILICLPIHLIVLVDVSDAAAIQSPTPALEADAPLEGRPRIVALSIFAVVLALNGFVFSAISAHVVPLFEGLGFTAASAVTFAAMIGPSQVASRIGEIILGRKFKTVHIGLVAIGLLPLALTIFAVGGFGVAAALAFAILYGMSNGLVTIARGAVPLALFGSKGYGLVLGTIAAPNLMLNALAPMLFSILLDRSGPQAGLLIALAIATVSAVGMFMLARVHPR